MSKVIAGLSRMSTMQQIQLAVGCGFLFMFLSMLFFGRMGHIGNVIGGVLFGLAFFAWGFMGLPMLIRREIPWFRPIRGRQAVVEGAVLLIGCWGIALFLVIGLLRGGK